MTDNQLETIEIWERLHDENPDMPVRQLTSLVCSATGLSYLDVIDAIQVDFNLNGI